MAIGGGAVMLSVSVVAAAVLFRLGRGLPEFRVQDLDIEDIENLTSAYTAVAKRLSAILALIGATIGLLIAAHFVKEAPGWVGSLVTSLGVFSVGFVVCRAMALVRGDLDLIGLQGTLMAKEARSSRVRERAQALDGAQKATPFKNPEGYGGLASR